MNHGVQKFPRLNIVQSPNNDIKFGIELKIFFLHPASVRDDLHSRAPPHYELRHHFCLHPPNIFLPEQKLTIQVGEVDCIHID